MTKTNVIAGAIGLGVGLLIGYFVGKKTSKVDSEKQPEVESEEKVEEEPDISESDYTEAVTKVEPKENDVLEFPLKDGEDARVSESVYHAPKLLGDSPIDEDDPSLEYEQETLHYFAPDDALTDELGHEVNENVLIGTEPRKKGFMRGTYGDDILWVRNYDMETDYQIVREDCSAADLFGGDGKVDDE